MNTLIVVPTRQCNLRCSYCPTVKDGWPSLTPADALRATDVFLSMYGGGEVKLFGGEPLLAPDVVDAVIERVMADDRLARVTLCTNGIGLDGNWIARLAGSKKVLLSVSLDGTPDDNRRFRRQLVSEDAYDRIAGLADRLGRLPNVVITQVIPPAAAARGSANFDHLLQLGFRRFKILPALYVPWSAKQLASLRQSLGRMAETIHSMWQVGRHVYVRNLFSRAANPTFNSALTVDADRRMYPSDLVLTDLPDDVRHSLRIGTIDAPPTLQVLTEAACRVERSLSSYFAPEIWSSTVKADEELTRFCRMLYPSWREWRRMREHVSAAVATA